MIFQVVSDWAERKVEEYVLEPIRDIKRVVIGIMLMMICIGTNQKSFIIRFIVATFGSIFFCIFGTLGRAFSKNVFSALWNFGGVFSSSMSASWSFMMLGTFIPILQQLLFCSLSGKAIMVYLVTITNTKPDLDPDILMRLGQALGVAFAVLYGKKMRKIFLTFLAGFAGTLGLNCIMSGGYCTRVLCRTLDESYCKKTSNKQVLICQLLILLIFYFL